MEPLLSIGFAALADTLIQKGTEAAVRLMSNPSWVKELSERACKEAGIPAARPAVEVWLQRKETADALASPNVSARARDLHMSLVQELVDQWTDRVGALPESVPIDRVADAILDHVVEGFISSLDPAAAVSVADARAESRHQELRSDIRRVEALLAVGDTFEERLKRMPPQIQRSLGGLRRVDPFRASGLIDAVFDDSRVPLANIRQLIGGEPTQFIRLAPLEFWLAVADVAAAYGARDLEVQAVDRAIDMGSSRRADLLARSAVALASLGERAAAEERLREAMGIDPSNRVADLVAATLEDDRERILSSSLGLPALVEGVGVGIIRALTLAGLDRIDEAIQLLRSILDGEPEWTAVQVWLANMLLTKAQSAQGDQARHLRLEALELGRRSRDLRRRWRGPSSESVEVMARAAIHLGDRRLAYGFCVTDGEATPEEARSPEVLQILLTLVLNRGDLKRAQEIADEIDSPYHRELAQGALAADSGNAEQAEVHLRQALSLARHDGERLDVIRYMSTAGIWPLPDFDEIREKDPDSAAILEASAFLVRNEPSRAIDALRPRRREKAKIADLLATAYSKAGRLDDAVSELQDAARYFRDPEFSARAAIILSEAGRQDQAFSVATRVAYELPPDSVLLPRIRVLLFNALGARHDWSGAEEQARRLLEATPTSPEAGWALTVALAKQSRLEEAWANVVARRLHATDIQQAQLWVALASRYASAPDWVETALDLIDRFPASEELHALVLTSTVQSGVRDLPETVGTRLTKSWNDFIERYPESQFLRAVKIGETDEEILGALRSILEPRSDAAIATAKAVDEGKAPLGVLASAANRSYIEAWLGDGKHKLFIYNPDSQINGVELAAAAAAIEKEVVLDGSAMAVLSALGTTADRILQVFSRQLIPLALRHDAREALDSSSSPTVGLMDWNRDLAMPVMETPSADDVQDRIVRSQWIVSLAAKLHAEEVTDLSDFPDAQGRVRTWLASLQLAKLRGSAFYCDDWWLRRLAESFGVGSFGTIDLLELLRGSGRIDPSAYESAIKSLITRRCVSLPMSFAQLQDLAASEDWVGDLAALQIAQPAFWRDPDAQVRYETLMTGVDKNNHAALPNWLFAGILGLARSNPQERALPLCAGMLAAAIAHYGDASIVPGLVAASRLVAKRLGIGDPLAASALALKDLLVKRLDYRAAIVAVTGLAVNLATEDAQVLKLPLFAPATGA